MSAGRLTTRKGRTFDPPILDRMDEPSALQQGAGSRLTRYRQKHARQIPCRRRSHSAIYRTCLCSDCAGHSCDQVIGSPLAGTAWNPNHFTPEGFIPRRAKRGSAHTVRIGFPASPTRATPCWHSQSECMGSGGGRLSGNPCIGVLRRRKRDANA